MTSRWDDISKEIIAEVEQEPSPALEQTNHVVYNAMTIDVEDYFHVTNFEPYISRSQWPYFPRTIPKALDRILYLLNEADVRATFFVLGWVAERMPEVVRAIDAGGHEVASHGYWHKRVFQHSSEDFRQDIRRSKHLLEDIIGKSVKGHRAPTFSIDQNSLWALDVLLEEGFEYDSSLFPGRIYRPGFAEGFRRPHNIESTGHKLIKEIPMTSLYVAGVRVPFAGGGFFRLYPYWLIRWGMKRINQIEGNPVIVYFHPWEMAPNQPRIRQAGMLPKFKHYVNLSSFESKFVRLMQDFKFKTCLELLDEYRL